MESPTTPPSPGVIRVRTCAPTPHTSVAAYAASIRTDHVPLPILLSPLAEMQEWAAHFWQALTPLQIGYLATSPFQLFRVRSAQGKPKDQQPHICTNQKTPPPAQQEGRIFLVSSAEQSRKDYL